MAIVLAVAVVLSGTAAAQDAPTGTPGTVTAQDAPTDPPGPEMNQATVMPGPSVSPGPDPSEPPVTPTTPVETPTPLPTDVPTETPTPAPTGTVPPTDTPTVPPVTPTVSPTLGPTVAPTEPPVIVAPTEPLDVPPTAPVSEPNDGERAIGPSNPISLSDPFDDPSARLLGETERDDSLIMGRYEDNAYRLEIEGPEVAPDLIAFVRAPVLADTTIHVNARLDGTTDGRYVMATCREVAGYGGYRAYLSPMDGFFAITRFEPGAVPTPLQQGFADELIQGNHPFDFDFSCNGYVLELDVNGETIGIAADNAFAAGTISIGTGFFVNAASGPVSAIFQELDVSGNVAMADQAGPARRAHDVGEQRHAAVDPRRMLPPS